jgi:hypothetical protein
MPEPDPAEYVDPDASEQARATVRAGSGANIGHGGSEADPDDEATKSLSSPGGERTDFSGVGDHGSNTDAPPTTAAPDVMAGAGATTPGGPPLPGKRLA